MLPPETNHSKAVLPPTADDNNNEREIFLHELPFHGTELLNERKTESDDAMVDIICRLEAAECGCMENHKAQGGKTRLQLKEEELKTLITRQHALLRLYYDFFFTLQHVRATPYVLKLAKGMPARLWSHGLRGFLVILMQGLPATTTYIDEFIWGAYSMVVRIYETYPASKPAWIDCLIGLARFGVNVAIQSRNKVAEEKWSDIGSSRCSELSDMSPETGRLYHHWATLASPDLLQQLFLFAKSLCTATPFQRSRIDIQHLFDSIMDPTLSQIKSMPAVAELAFVRVHAIIFKGQDPKSCLQIFVQTLDSRIQSEMGKWLQAGYHVAITNCCSLFSYSYKASPFSTIDDTTKPMESSSPADSLKRNARKPQALNKHALELFARSYNVVLGRYSDPNVLPYLHVTLSFMYRIAFYPDVFGLLAASFDWERTAIMLNEFIRCPNPHLQMEPCDERKTVGERAVGGVEETGDGAGNIGDAVRTWQPRPFEADSLPDAENGRPLPEDHAMRGLPWAIKTNFGGAPDYHHRYVELASLARTRKERILWFARRFAQDTNYRWLLYESREFRDGERKTGRPVLGMLGISEI